MKKTCKYFPEFDFVRVLCTIGIIVYHYCCHVPNRDFLPLYNYVNDGWGNLLVTIFFVISGALLYYNHGDIGFTRKYFFTRWKSIFPCFYLAFIFFYIQNVIQIGKPLYLPGGHAASMLLTLVGMDGYFGYRVHTYYILGEWFLGAIVLLYLLYPMIVRVLEKQELIGFVLITFGFLFLCHLPYFKILSFRNLFSCLFSFAFGILVAKHDLKKSKVIAIISLIVFLVFYFVALPPYGKWLATHITGMAFCLVLLYVGQFIMKSSVLCRIFQELASISYQMFLLQHIVILWVLQYRHPGSAWKSAVLLLVIIALTIAYAKVLSIVTDYVVKSAVMKRFEKIFCRG